MPLRPSSSSTASPVYLVYLLVAACGVAVYLAVDSEVVRTGVRVLLGLSAVAAMAVGVRLHRPASSLPWYLFSIGILACVVGDLLVAYQGYVVGYAAAFPSVADFFYLSGYPLGAAGVLLLVRGRHAHAAAFIDAAVVSVAGTLYLWVFLIKPVVLDSGAGLSHDLTHAVYLIGDVLLLILLARMTFIHSLANKSQILLAAGLAVLFAGEALTSLVQSNPTLLPTEWLHVGLVFAYPLWGAGALHREMAEKIDDKESERLSLWRLGALGLALVSVPFAYTLQRLVAGEVATYDTTVMGVVLSLLVLARLVIMMKGQERLRQKAERSERYFRSLIENSADIIAVVGEDGVVKYESPSLARVLGFSPEERVGQSAFSNLHPEDSPKAQETFAALLSGQEKVAQLRLRSQHKSGSWRTLECVAQNFLHDPAVRGVVVNAHDVTKSEELGQQLRQSQKMDAVGQLAGGVAHDFNNLLMAISGYAELAGFELDEGGDGARANIDEIQKAAARAAALTNQLLLFSRQHVSSPRAVDVEVVVTGLESMLDRLTPESIELRFRAEGGPHIVVADPHHLEQVLMNLVVNARDAMPQGGVVEITVGRVDLAEARVCHSQVLPAGDYVVLSVADTGSGIDEEKQARVFEPFFTTKEVGKGTGLGLSTVYGIVDEAGGAVDLDSRVGEGTRFDVYLPAFSAPLPSTDSETAETAPAEKELSPAAAVTEESRFDAGASLPSSADVIAPAG